MDLSISLTDKQVIESCKTIANKDQINLPHVVNRITDKLPRPTKCPKCHGEAKLVSNAKFYAGREFGWPLAYACRCGARIGCHPNTTIPLGIMADQITLDARKQAHAVFDPLWRDKGPGARRRAYSALEKAMGVEKAHIGWMNAAQCMQVVEICRNGLKV